MCDPSPCAVTCVQINKRDHGYQMAKEALIRKKALMEQVSRRPSPTPTASPSHPSPSLMTLPSSSSSSQPPPLTPHAHVEQIPDQTNVGTISDFMFKAGVQV